MSLVIEENLVELQTKTTKVLVAQQVILSAQDKVDGFLDRINASKAEHERLISNYSILIEEVVTFLEEERTIEHLFSVAEAINNLADTTKRLIRSLSTGKSKNCFNHEVNEYKIRLNDIQEIHGDISSRISVDPEMTKLLANF